MARARNIKPSFFDNDELAELAPLARLLFIGMWTIADHNGNFEWREKKIKKQLLAYDNCDIKKFAINLDKSGFIRFYSDGHKVYVNIVNFDKHQNPHKNEREKGSSIPEIIAEARQAIDLITLTINPDKSRLIPEHYTCNRADSLNLIPDSCPPDSNVDKSTKVSKMTPYAKIVSAYEKHLNGNEDLNLVEMEIITDKRKDAIKNLYQLVEYDFEKIDKYFEWIYNRRESHSWLFGDNSNNWKADIEYLSRQETFAKAKEGRLGNWSGSAA